MTDKPQLELVAPTETVAVQGELALPDVFESIERRAQQLAEPPRAANTRRAWARACASYVEHLQSVEGRAPHQGTPDAVVRWIATLEAKGLKPQSIAQLVSSVGGFAKSQDAYDPTDHRDVRNALGNLRRQHDADVRKRRPVKTEEVRQLVAHCPDDTQGVRDRALILVLYATSMRRASLVALNCSDVEFVDEGMRVTLRRSKTDQVGKGRVLNVDMGNNLETCPVRALRRWMGVLFELHLDIEDGAPLFHGLNKRREPRASRIALRSVNHIVDQAAKRAGLDVQRIGTHSFRRGHAHQLLDNGVQLVDVADSLGHASIDTTRGYADERPDWQRKTTKRLGL